MDEILCKIKYDKYIWDILLSFDQEKDITSVRITVLSTNPVAANGIITELYVLYVEDKVEFVNNDIDKAMRTIQEGTLRLFINFSDSTISYRV